MASVKMRVFSKMREIEATRYGDHAMYSHMLYDFMLEDVPEVIEAIHEYLHNNTDYYVLYSVTEGMHSAAFKSNKYEKTMYFAYLRAQLDMELSGKAAFTVDAASILHSIKNISNKFLVPADNETGCEFIDALDWINEELAVFKNKYGIEPQKGSSRKPKEIETSAIKEAENSRWKKHILLGGDYPPNDTSVAEAVIIEGGKYDGELAIYAYADGSRFYECDWCVLLRLKKENWNFSDIINCCISHFYFKGAKINRQQFEDWYKNAISE